MKHFTHEKGSALLTVVMIIAIMAVLTASMLRYSGGEQRSNERQRLILRSRNMTENVILYSSEQITNKLYKLRTSSPMAFMGTNAITLPSADILKTAFSTEADVATRAGLTTTSGLSYIDPLDPINEGNPNAGLQISTSAVPIIAKSTMRHSAIGEVTTYAQQNLEVAMMPLFQFAVFYNMDMEFGPGPNMTISGPVHTNGNFIARIQSGFTNTLRFTDRVTTAKGFYANTAHRGGTYMANGSLDNGPGGTGPLQFQNPAGTVTDIKDASGNWRDHKWTSSSTPSTVAETATSQGKFKSFATSAYGGNLRTSLHGVTNLALPAIGDYDENDPVKKKNGRQLIEIPATTDAGGVLGTKISRNAGLYIVVNPDSKERDGTLPDGSAVTMRARSYRAWLNTVNLNGSHSLTEVVLPGQPSYGSLNEFVNTLPNAYRTNTSVGSNQIVRIPKGGGFDLPDTGYSWNGTPASGYVWTGNNPAPDFDSSPSTAKLLSQDAYFFDMRRAINHVGYPFDRTSSAMYRPRAIAKIDFDMTRFKMAVERTLFDSTTSTVYYPALPSDTTTWNASIFNSSGTPASFGLGLAVGSDTSFTFFANQEQISALHYSQAAAYSLTTRPAAPGTPPNAPTTLTINSVKQTDSGTVDPYAGYFKIETSTDNGATWTGPGSYTSTANESVYSYTPKIGITHLRVSQYVAGATTTLLDQQIIPVVADIAPLAISCKNTDSGDTVTLARFAIFETTTANPSTSSTWTLRYTSAADEAGLSYTPTAGTSGIRVQQFAAGTTSPLVREQIIPVVTASLSNDRFIVPMTNSTTVSPGAYSSVEAVTEMRIYVGGIDDTANWTFNASTITGSVTGSLGGGLVGSSSNGSGRFANRYVATGMSTSSGTTEGKVTITAKKFATGGTSTSISKTFILVKQGSSSIPSAPAKTGYWLAIGGGLSPDPFKIYRAPTTTAEVDTAKANPSVFALGSTDFVRSGTTPSPWFDGVTVYVQSVGAEDLSITGTKNTNTEVRNRVASGVRLWNGRSPLISLPGATYPGRTGLSFVTNDAVYIVGHYNADGSTDSNLTHNYTGGYSGRYPESTSEMLTAVMGDAITILSQPLMTRSGSSPDYTYAQTSGWADSLSANTRDTSASYSTSWASTNPGSSNQQDGIQTAIQPAMLPNLTVSSSVLSTDTTAVTRAGPRAATSSSPATQKSKFKPSETEVSTCLLTGIVPTTVVKGDSTTAQTSGGVHNFPRLSENWAGDVALYIRGSLVAMFESQVATEPWSIRYYQGAIRNWGLHQSLRDANHDVPLEPIVLGASRMSYRELTAQEYEAQKAIIEALPH